jgi:ABC-type antimicrobial peptide transport system permease subunit
MRLVFAQGAGLTAIAVTIGLVISMAATTVLKTMLYQVAPRDPATFVAVAGVLTLVALLATWLPARRAVRTNPVIALRDA